MMTDVVISSNKLCSSNWTSKRETARLTSLTKLGIVKFNIIMFEKRSAVESNWRWIEDISDSSDESLTELSIPFERSYDEL